MKTIEQANRYLSSCIFDDENWNMVLEFCREIYGGGKVHRPRRGSTIATYADFLIWWKYCTGSGDIIRYGKIIGLLGKCTPRETYLKIYIGQNGQLIQKDMIVPNHRLESATYEEIKQLKNLMFAAKISYSVSLDMITKLYTPAEGDFVVVRTQNYIRLGIFKNMDFEGYTFYYLDGKELTTLPYADHQLEAASSKEGLELMEQLSRLGLMWNPRTKQLLPVHKKAEPGGKYWYVNDKFYVCQAKDTQTPTHKERYNNGNYFTSYAEALVFIKKLKDLRMELNKGIDQ